MAKIAFLLLAHRDPADLAAKARVLASHGDRVVIHFDASAPRADWSRLRNWRGRTGSPSPGASAAAGESSRWCRPA